MSSVPTPNLNIDTIAPDYPYNELTAMANPEDLRSREGLYTLPVIHDAVVIAGEYQAGRFHPTEELDESDGAIATINSSISQHTTNLLAQDRRGKRILRKEIRDLEGKKGPLINERRPLLKAEEEKEDQMARYNEDIEILVMEILDKPEFVADFVLRAGVLTAFVLDANADVLKKLNDSQVYGVFSNLRARIPNSNDIRDYVSHRDLDARRTPPFSSENRKKTDLVGMLEYYAPCSPVSLIDLEEGGALYPGLNESVERMLAFMKDVEAFMLNDRQGPMLSESFAKLRNVNKKAVEPYATFLALKDILTSYSGKVNTVVDNRDPRTELGHIEGMQYDYRGIQSLTTR